MEHEGERSEAMEIKVFADDAVELIDPRTPMPHLDPPAPPRPLRSRKWLALALFLTTCVSTFLVGMTPGNGFALVESIFTGRILQASPELLLQFMMNGLTFSGAVMLTLLAHEMGHYLQARRYGVPASLPYFIPLPISPFGTLGAVIVQAGGVANRKQMYDIAISGPLAGLVFALPITYIGITQETVVSTMGIPTTPIYGQPLLLQWMVAAVHGPNVSAQLFDPTPLMFAGWVGIFVTALNLIPIGQLDGGHILYTLIG